MKTKEEFEEYFNTTIKSVIEPLEIERLNLKTEYDKNTKKLQKTAITIIAIAIAISIILPGLHMLIMFGGMGFIGVLYFKIFKIQLGLYNPKTTLEIKRTLVESFMSFYGNDFKYYDTKDISKDLVDCRLLDGANTKTYCAEYYVDSLIKDEILPDEGTKVELIGLSYGNLDSSGKSIKLPIGQFIIIDFNKNFNGEFIILEGKSLVDKFGGMSRIKLEDNEFEGKFDFFGTDQIEGRYILTPSLIQRIKCYQGKMNSIKISFVKNKIYIIKVMKTPIFDVKMDRSLYDMEPMLEYYNVLNMIYGIVDELNLNTRIWTR